MVHYSSECGTSFPSATTPFRSSIPSKAARSSATTAAPSLAGPRSRMSTPLGVNSVFSKPAESALSRVSSPNQMGASPLCRHRLTDNTPFDLAMCSPPATPAHLPPTGTPAQPPVAAPHPRASCTGHEALSPRNVLCNCAPEGAVRHVRRDGSVVVVVGGRGVSYAHICMRLAARWQAVGTCTLFILPSAEAHQGLAINTTWRQE